MQIFTLENVKSGEVIKILNAAFADYFVKIELTEKTFAEKTLLENIVLEKSAGAFEKGKLVGFILLGTDDWLGNKTAYNAGTGVLAEFRGNNLTSKMYEFILPSLKSEGIHFHQLEVITKNLAALKTYQKIGFETVRTLTCLRGIAAPNQINRNIELRILDEISEQLFPQFWNSQPSWQNSLAALRRTKDLYKIIGAFDNSELAGYIIYSDNGRVKQFGVRKDCRHSGIAQTLFGFIQRELNEKEMIITNIDKTDRQTILFLKRLGLNLYLEQFEMILKV